MKKYNHAQNELDLLQKIANLMSIVLELYSKGKISKEVKEILVKEISK